MVQMVGEGYEDDVTLDNIHSVSAPTDVECEEGNMADDDVTGMCAAISLHPFKRYDTRF